MRLALAGAVTLLITGTAAGVGVARPAADPARLQVTAREFTLVLSRGAVSSGPVIIELVNLGEDDHDLAFRRRAPNAVTRRIPTVGPGRHRTGESRLRPGRYVLWCTLADHRARGMRAGLIVRPRPN